MEDFRDETLQSPMRSFEGIKGALRANSCKGE